MGFMSVVFLFPTSPGTSVQDMNYTIAVFGGVMVISLIYYYLPVYGGVNWFTGPVANIGVGDTAFPDSASGSFTGEKKEITKVDTVVV